MQYKVVPFHPTVLDKGGVEQAAKELQDLIDQETGEGWKFKSLESMSTTVQLTGCASFNQKPEVQSVQMCIFEK